MKKNIIKKLIVLTVSIIVVASLFGCSDNNQTNQNDKKEESTKNSIPNKTEDSTIENLKDMPEIEQLLSNAFGKDKIVSGDIDLKVSIDVSSYIAEMNTKISADMKMDTNISFENNKYYTKGEINANILGQSVSQIQESYIDKSNDYAKVYEKDVETDEWMMNIDNEEDNNSNAFLNLLDIEMKTYNKFKLYEEKNNYKITGSLSADNILKLLGVSGEEFFGDFIGTTDIKYEDMTVTLTMLFDKDAQILEKYIVKFDKFKSEEFSLNEMRIELIINNINDTIINLPEDLIEYLENNKTEIKDESESTTTLPEIKDEDESIDNSSNITNSISSRDLYDYNGNKICTVNLIKGFSFDLNDSAETLLFLEYVDNEVSIFSVSVFGYLISSIEDFDKDKYNTNSELYLKNEVCKLGVVTTNQGDATIYKRIYSMFEGIESTEFWVALKTINGYASFSIDGKYLTKSGYTIEKMVQEMFK